MGPPGLMYVRTRVIHPHLSYETFNKWYNEILKPEILKAAKGSAAPGPPTAVRYVHVYGEEKSEFPYLALYPLPDVGWLKSAEWRDVPRSSTFLSGDGGHMNDSIEFQIRVYQHIRTFEGQKEPPHQGRADHMVIVCSEASEAKGVSDAEFDEWDRKQHLDMMSLTRGLRRGTRYELLSPNDETVVGAEKFEDIPRFSAMYEFDGELDWDAMKMTKNTERSRRIVQGYHSFYADEWDLYRDFGDEERQLGVYL